MEVQVLLQQFSQDNLDNREHNRESESKSGNTARFLSLGPTDNLNQIIFGGGGYSVLLPLHVNSTHLPTEIMFNWHR